MTKQELLDAIRAATGPSRELDAEIALSTGYFDRLKLSESCRLELGAIADNYVQVIVKDKGSVSYSVELPRLTSSLDAANAFRERMLPGWAWRLTHNFRTKLYEVQMHKDIHAGEYAEAIGLTNGAAAICAAVIAALIAQETNRD